MSKKEEASRNSEELYFETDAALIDRLGRELVGRQETALIELVKNSYDADSTHVRVTLEADSIVVKDDGIGMTRDDLVDGFLRLASDKKVRQPRSKIYSRQLAGRKGIGRFATQRLGERLILRTWTKEGEVGLELTINWRDFQAGRDLDNVAVSLRAIEPGSPGTTLRIESLRDSWSNAQVRRSWRGLLALQQPFPVSRRRKSAAADPGFSVKFFRDSSLFEDPELVADFQTEILSHLHAVIEFRVDPDGVAEWRITKNKFGPDTSWTPTHHLSDSTSSDETYPELSGVAMKAHYVILDSRLLPSLVFTRVRDTLREEGGIRLYRNGFRVVPYGEPGNDWLRLDETYSKRSTILDPIANRNFFGVIEIDDPQGEVFEEHTSREGLIENDAYQALARLARTVLTSAVRKIAEDRVRTSVRQDASEQEKLRAQRLRIERLEAAARAAREAEAKAKSERGDETAGSKAGDSSNEEEGQESSAADLIEESIKQIRLERAELADSASMLRLLSTLGLSMSEFSHETGMTFEAFRMDFDAVFEAAIAAKAEDEVFSEQANRAKSMLERLDALTAYLNELASARSVRELQPVSVKKSIVEFKNGIGKLAHKAGVDFDIAPMSLDPLYTAPMHSAELASVLLNFYSNSIKALKREGGERKIRIEAGRDGDDVIVIQFSDSGDGIAEEDREKVFDLFYTTSIAAEADAPEAEQYTGTGLGLWIVRQIISKVGGEVELVDPPAGFTTCFEVRLPAEPEE